MKVKIYVLKDPRTKEVMYVGQTKKSLPARLSNHYNDTGRIDEAKRVWLGELTSLGLKAIIEQVDEVESDIANKRETFFIKYYRRFQPALLNLNRGPKGFYGEQTVVVPTKVPKSKVTQFKKEVKAKVLKKWEVKKK